MMKNQKKTTFQEKFLNFFLEEWVSKVYFIVAVILIIITTIFCLYMAKVRVSVCDWPFWVAMTLASGVSAFASLFATQLDGSGWTNKIKLNKILGIMTGVCLLTLLVGTIGTSPLFQGKALHDEVAPYVHEMEESAFPNYDTSNLPLYGEAEAEKRLRLKWVNIPLWVPNFS